MNYLAHVYLSGSCLDTQLGGLLGDFVKGPLPLEWLEPAQLESLQRQAQLDNSRSLILDRQARPWPREILCGVFLHRAIDAFIDQHPLFKECVARLGPEHRRIAGIALDVYFDHLLASQWADVQSSELGELGDFSERFYQHCRRHYPAMPENAAQLMQGAHEYRLFENYASLETIESVLSRIAQRLSRQTSLNRVMPVLQRESTFLAQAFTELMPVLEKFSVQQRQRLLP